MCNPSFQESQDKNLTLKEIYKKYEVKVKGKCPSGNKVAFCKIKKLSIFLILSIFIIQLISAQTQLLQTQKQNQCMQIINTNTNTTSTNITKIEYPSNCNYPVNYTISPMSTINNINYYYTFCNTTCPGEYGLTICNNKNGEFNCVDYKFLVTPTGSELSTSKSILFIIILSTFIIFLIGGVYGMSKSINGAWTIFYICLTYISLFSLFFILWLFSSNYLYETEIISSIFWILWLVMAYGFLPFIIVISVYIIGKGVEDNLIKEYISQGYTREEALEMAKKRKR